MARQIKVFRQRMRQELAVRSQIRDLVNQLFDGDPMKLIENIFGKQFREEEAHAAASNPGKLRLLN